MALTVSASVPQHLAFGQQPANTTATAAISPGVTVAILDQYGNLTTSTAPVSVTANGPAAFTGSSTISLPASAGIATFNNLHLNTDGTYTITPTSTVTGTTSTSFNVTGLAVASFTPTTTGFVATFSTPFNDATSPTPQINLYDASSINAGPADVTLVSNTTGKAITGSLLINPSNATITFVKTTLVGTNGKPLTNAQGLLPADTYTVTLVSGSTAFKAATGGSLLDGNADGTPGDNYTTTFTVNPVPATAVVVDVPDFARAPMPWTPSTSPTTPARPLVSPLRSPCTLRRRRWLSAAAPGWLLPALVQRYVHRVHHLEQHACHPGQQYSHGLGGVAAVGGTGNVTVTVTPTAPFTATITFANAVANPSLMTVSLNSLTPAGQTITITNPNAPSNVTDATLTLDYNANLLTISGGTVNSALTGASFLVATSGSGSSAQATITFHTTSGLALGTLGSVLLGGLNATVPNNAAYKSKELLHFDLTSGAESINAGAIPVVATDGLQVVAYRGGYDRGRQLYQCGFG